MPTHNLSKIQKKIVKKKGGRSTSLHENSRDLQRLRRAGARSERLDKLAAARTKAHGPLLQRISYFQGAAKAASSGAIAQDKIHELIQRYLDRSLPELAQLKAERRPGRPSSTKEDLLKQRIEEEEREYNIGFWLPDMGDEKNLEVLREWGGAWEGLNTVKFVRMGRDGRVKGSKFPPKGDS